MQPAAYYNHFFNSRLSFYYTNYTILRLLKPLLSGPKVVLDYFANFYNLFINSLK